MSDPETFLTSKDIESFEADLIKQVKRLEAQIQAEIDRKADDDNFQAHLTAARSLRRYLEENLSIYLIQNIDGEDYPKAFSRDVLLRNASDDFLMIKRSFQEASSDQLDHQEDAKRLRRLIQLIALDAFNPAVGPFFLGVFDHSTPQAITYQTSRFEIRVVPYSSVIFIGYPAALPFNAEAFDANDGYQLVPSFVAIAHEIGHKVFNHGYIAVGENQVPIEGYLRTKIKAVLGKNGYSVDEIEWANAKLEELFSDAYGCLIDGPASVLGFQKQMELGRPAVGMELTHRYLYAPIRTLAQSRILRQLADGPGDDWAQDAAGLLDQRWQNWVTENWTKWLAAQWPELALAGDFSPVPKVELIQGSRYPFGDKIVIGHRLLEILELVIEEIAIVLRDIRPDWKRIDLAGVEHLELLLMGGYTDAARALDAAGAALAPDGAMNVIPGVESKTVLAKILGQVNLGSIFEGDQSEAEKFVGSILGEETPAEEVEKTAKELLANQAESDAVDKLIDALVEQHDRGILPDGVLGDIMPLLTAKTVRGDQIDEIVERQLLRGWSDEGPRNGGTGGF